MNSRAHTRTERLRLDAVTHADLAQIHELHADPEVWQHFPSGRHTDPKTTAAFVANMERDWAGVGLGYWAVRHRGGSPGGDLLGLGGCAVRYGAVWNLYYRFTPAAQGHGYAAETIAAAQTAAAAVHPGLPVIASLLEHNAGSKATAERAGLQLAYRGPDAERNPDPAAIRLIYADRPLSSEILDALTRGPGWRPASWRYQDQHQAPPAQDVPGCLRWRRLGRGRARGAGGG